MKSLWTTFRNTYLQLKWQIIGWGLGIASLGLMIVPFYEVFGGQQEQFRQMIENYPPEMLAFFGGDAASVLTPEGYLKMYAFSMLPIIVGIFSLLAGSGLIVTDEERGRMDLIITHPVGRSALFFGRFLGLLGAMITVLLVGWLGFCVMLNGSGVGVTWGQMAVPLVSLLAQLIIYAALAVLLSMVLPTRNLSAMGTGLVLVISYFMTSLVFLDERLETIAKFLPHQYYQTALSFQDLNLTWLLGLLAISAGMILISWILFTRRDIRLGGEGSWQLPKLLLKR